MIQINSLHYNAPASTRNIRSHILTPHDSVTLFMIVDGADDGIVSIIEDHLLESISSTEWHPRDTGHDFSYVTEHYNQFIANIASDDTRDIHIVLAMLMGEELTLSTIGRGHGVFVESEGELTDISIHE